MSIIAKNLYVDLNNIVKLEVKLGVGKINKTGLFKAAIITLTFYVLMTTVCFAAYPGPDEQTTEDKGVLEGVKTIARGYYETGYPNIYKDTYHWCERWAIWPSCLDGYLTVTMWTDGWSQGPLEYIYGDAVGGPGFNMWTTEVGSYAYSSFTAWGGSFSHSCSSIVYAGI